MDESKLQRAAASKNARNELLTLAANYRSPRAPMGEEEMPCKGLDGDVLPDASDETLPMSPLVALLREVRSYLHVTPTVMCDSRSECKLALCACSSKSRSLSCSALRHQASRSMSFSCWLQPIGRREGRLNPLKACCSWSSQKSWILHAHRCRTDLPLLEAMVAVVLTVTTIGCGQWGRHLRADRLTRRLAIHRTSQGRKQVP